MITSTKDSALRQAAIRKGYTLHKSRSQFSGDNYGGYMIVDLNTCIVAGERFDLSPEQVRDFLNEQ